MTISRSDGVSIVARLGTSTADTLLPSSSRFSTAFLLLVQLIQVIVQTDELLLPQAPIRLQPVIDVLEPCCDECAGTSLRVSPTRNQPRTLQHFQMLRDRRLAE